MNFVIGDMQAFSVVESPEFIKWVTGLQPGKTVMTRKTLTGNIEDEYKTMHDDLQQKLSLVTVVCTTADIWTAHNRSFFGVTVHWIEISTLERKSAALACSRLRGRHTFDLIAATLEELHSSY
ncbi:AC transposase [Biomphalaria pfeifferi]|uniref:AC transposase n=1 Tax=Biomphalaria pfeifferi TaxID=112525 RepID=A0AAD8BT84_BIOPF|nr:AC transposase [Biomphalaria pfeifferi]